MLIPLSPVEPLVRPVVGMRAMRPGWLPVGASLHLDYINDRGFALGTGIALPTSLITFTRATTRTYFNSAGVLSTAAINTPAIDYNPVTLACRGLSIEEARTNLLTYSEQFDNAAWTLGGTDATVTANTTTAPDGTLTADTITDSDVVNRMGKVNVATVANDSVLRVLSVYILKTTAATTFPGVQLQYGNGGVTVTAACTVNTNTGVLTDRTSFAPTNKSIESAGLFWRVSVGLSNNSSGNTAALAYIFPAVNSDASGAWVGTTTGSCVVWGAQLEAGSFITSPIPTVASQVTRAADVAVISGANFSNFYNQSEGTFVIEWNTSSTAANAVGRVIFGTADGTFTNTAYIGKPASTMFLDLVLNSGGVNQLTSMAAFTLAASGSAKDAFSYKANDVAFSHDGAAVGTDATVTVAPGQNILGLGTAPWNPGGNIINGNIRSITYHPTRLTNAQLQTLST